MHSQDTGQRAGTLMTVSDVCVELRCGLTTAYRLMGENKLEKVKLGSATRITRASFDRLLARLRANAA